MRKITLGIVGLGFFFQKIHIPALQRLRDKFDIKAVYTSDLQKFRKLRKFFPAVRHCRDLKDLFADPSVEALTACVPIPEHASMAQRAIAARKALLLEKPLAARLSQGGEILRLSRKHRVPVMVAESFRYFEVFRTLKGLLDKKVLGPVEFIQVQAVKRFDRRSLYYRKGWRLDSRLYPGILWDAGIHTVSLLQFLFGRLNVRHKSLHSHDPHIGRKDTISAHISFPRAEGLFLMSYGLYGQEEKFLTIYCARGRVKCGIDSFIVESDKGKKEYRFRENVYPKIYGDFYGLIARKRRPAYPLSEAYEDLKAVDRLLH